MVAYSEPRSNFSATVDPSTSDDTTLGYGQGSRWLNTSTNVEWVCTDATEGAANWVEGGGAGGQELYDAIVAPSGGDYTLPSAAFTAGHTRVWIRAGTYNETADVVIPNGGALHGSSGAVLVMGAFQVKIDGQARLTTAGTFSVTSGSTAVTGSGTSFTTLQSGDFIAIGPDFYEISSITDATNLTLVKPWRGPNRSGLPMLGQGMYEGAVLRGITITGSTHVDGGLFIRGLHNGLIHQVAVRDCTHNVKVQYSGNFEIAQTLSFNSTNDGLTFENCRSVAATDFVAANNTGIGANIIGGGIAMKFTNCEFSVNGGIGAFVGGTSTDTVFTGCGAKQNSGKGIETAPGTVRAVIDGCTIQFNAGVGVDVDGTQNVVSNCQIGNNGSTGVFGGSRCQLLGNFVHNNTGVGISLNGDTDSVVIGNTCDSNTSHGIDVTTTNDALIQANRVIGNGGWGLQIGSGSARNRVGGNIFTGNSSGSITDASSTTQYISSSVGQLSNNILLRGSTGLAGGGSGVKGSGITVDDSNNMTGLGTLAPLNGATTFALSGVLSPASIGANQNDYNPSGLSTATTLRLTSSGNFNITGLAGGSAGRFITLHNIGSNTLTLPSESTLSAAANRFITRGGVSLTLSPNASVMVQYDATTSRWRVLGGTSTGGAVLANFSTSATDAISTSSLTDVLVTGLTVTPGAGTYFVSWSMTAAHNKAGQTVFGSLYAAGSQVSGTEREVGGQAGNKGNTGSSAVITVSAGQAIEARWRVSSNSGGGQGDTPGPRTLTAVRIS